MATQIIYGDAADGYIASDHPTVYADAREGAGTIVINDALTALVVGQDISTAPKITCYETFLSFDTSASASPLVAARLELNLIGGVTTNFIVEARSYDWGTALTSADWVAGSALSGLPLVASLDTTTLGATNAYYVFTEVDLVSNINGSGSTRLVLNSSLHRLGTTPSLGNDEAATFAAADFSGTTRDPKLTLTYATVSSDEILNPDLDVAINSWTTDTGATTNLYAAIDELTASDTDYIQSPAAPTTAQYYETALETKADPVSSSGHIVHYRYQKNVSGGAVDLTVGLYEGTTLRKSYSHTNIANSWVTQDQTLSGAEADSITNYSDLRLRFTPNQTSSTDVSERLAPDAVLSSTNLTGATLANIDEDPDSSDGAWAVATSNNVATDVRVSFGTPTGTLRTGAGLQEFRALVRQNPASGSGTPTARIELWEGGSLVSAGSEVNVTSLSGQVISFTWDATGRTAASIECKVVGTQTGGSPAVRSSVDVGAVEWNAATSIPGHRVQVSWANFELPAAAAVTAHHAGAQVGILKAPGAIRYGTAEA